MFPEELRYSKQHEWVREGNGTYVRVGITAHAAHELGDIVYVSLPVVGEEVSRGDTCTEVESTKSTSDVFVPVSGVITAVNSVLIDSPEIVNEDPYGDGWLFEVELANPEELEDLLDADGYEDFIANS